MQQNVKASFAGSVNVAGMGAINATVDGKNSHKTSYLTSYQFPLGKDFMLIANAGFGGRKLTRLEISKHF